MEDPITIESEETKKIFIVNIDGKNIKLLLSRPFVAVCDILNSDGNTNYRNIFNRWVYNGITEEQRGIVAAEDIDNLSDDVFDDIINSFLQDDKQWMLYYENTDLYNDIRDRLILAYIRSIADEISKSVVKFQAYLQENITPLVESFGNFLKKPIERSSAIKKVQESLNAFSNSLQQTIRKIKVPAISDEQKQKLLESYEKWGAFGWTPYLNAPGSFYSNCPNDYKEADRLALGLLSKDAVKTLFEELRSMRVPKKDLEEAVACFDNRCYKACAMILLSIIDGRIIRLQKDANKRKNNDANNQDINLRVCGDKAIKFLQNKINEKINVDQTIFLLLHLSCVYKCLGAYFEVGHNFTLETNLANRSLVFHGMNRKPVRRKDCLKLFLLIYNLFDLIDLLGV